LVQIKHYIAKYGTVKTRLLSSQGLRITTVLTAFFYVSLV